MRRWKARALHAEAIAECCEQIRNDREQAEWTDYERLRWCAEQVVREAESVHYMGRMEVSVEAIHALQAACKIIPPESGSEVQRYDGDDRG